MVFGGMEAPFASPHNDPLVVEMKIASIIVRRILISMGSSVDIITWDCLKKLTYLGRGIVSLVHPILGFGGQECEYDLKKRKKMKKEEQGKKRGLHIGFSTALTTLIFRSLGISIQGVSGLIPCTITLTGRRNKLHHLGVSALVLGPLALIDVVESPWLPQSWPLKAPPPAGTVGLFSRPLGHLVQPSAFPSAANTGLPAPPTFGTLLLLSPLERTLLSLSAPPR
ncbi:hypothetical protein Cgig2_032196 [Carnegiea gigantea]|uniref:Uncharacterized protein n=1 Tax=Carnegiea gigantea TaxID=171969 RepID=A0A9Q1K4Q0_9CARY|nr:hypothetical protein Cgig2_032196 [Carnegiea gigantea]